MASWGCAQLIDLPCSTWATVFWGGCTTVIKVRSGDILFCYLVFFFFRKLSAGCFPNKTILVFNATPFKSACVTEFASYVKVKSHFRGAQWPPGLRVSTQCLLWQCFLSDFLWCLLSMSWPGLPRAFSFLLQTSQLSDLLWKIRCSYMSYLDMLDVSWV